MIRVWLVDDDPRICRELSSCLASHAGEVELSSWFATGSDALKELARGAEFDVALIDLGLPGMTGETLIRSLRRERPRVPILVYTVRADDGAVFSALRAGAVGYLTKSSSLDDLVAGVRAAVSGGAPLAAEISRQVVSSFWQIDSSRECEAELTPREHEVLELLCTGASYREVGTLLGIAEGTVQSHVKSLYSKLGVTSKAEAVRMAMSLHLIQQ
jgi:DNA-binding NarL/FixJ family response regulator